MRSAWQVLGWVLTLALEVLVGQDAADDSLPVTLLRKAHDSRPEVREAAWQELLLFGEEGRRELQSAVTEQWKKDQRGFERLARGGLKKHQKALRARLDERRKLALEAIFDHSLYPDEAHGAVGQPEVDLCVGALRDLWNHPALVVAEWDPPIDALLCALESDLKWLATSGLEVEETMDTWIERADGELDVRSMTDALEWNEEIDPYNDSCTTSLDPEERAVIDHTNEYRRMLGLRVLEIDERLARAARKHSAEMAELDYFGHESPVEAHRSPSARARLEGYGGGVAENCAGGSNGESAFQGWYGSSGHHRNMLGSHVQIGVGRADNGGSFLYTQCFGSSDSVRTREVKDPRILYLERAGNADPEDVEAQWKLSWWCKGRGLVAEVRRHASKVIELDPEHSKARKILGFEKIDGQWVRKEEEKDDDERVRDLRRSLKSEDPAERKRALEALADQPEVEDSVFQKSLQDEAAEVRAAAANALGRRRVHAALPGLKKLLSDPNPYTRHEVVMALFNLGDGAGVERLLVDLDGDQESRLSAGRRLREIAGQSFGYSWDLPLAERTEAIARAREWWERERERLLEEQRDAVPAR